MTPEEFRDLLADPAAPEQVSGRLVTVDVTDPRTASALTGLDVTALPCVVALVVPDPAVLPDVTVGDVVLTDDPTAPRPFVTGGADALADRVRANPVASIALTLLLRAGERLGVPAALVAESATYSTLQAGAEFERWRTGRAPRSSDPVTDRVLLDRRDDVVRITLNRPTRRNAVDRHLRDALVDALAVAAADPDCDIEIDAAGPDFCAGGDLDEFGSRTDPAAAHLTRLTRSPARLLHTIADRTTVSVHGNCLGAGVELPSFAGRVVATADARFGLPEVAMGLIPGAGGTVSLPRRIGRHRTAWLALSGQVLTADNALDWGLVDTVLPGKRTVG